jgi:hypothetical protein
MRNLDLCEIEEVSGGNGLLDELIWNPTFWDDPLVGFWPVFG